MSAKLIYLTISAVAERYHITPERARELARQKGFGKKVSGTWCFTPEDVSRLRPGKPGRPRKEVM